MKLRAPLVSVIAIALAACHAHDDFVPQIAVQPGAAARAMALTGRTGAGVNVPPPPAAAPRGARVHAMAIGEELGGVDASGRGEGARGAGAGDWMIENDEVAFVIDRSGRLVDAADARGRRDELGELAVTTADGRAVVVLAITSGSSPEGTAWVEARGHDAQSEALHVVTRFTLHGGDRALLVETTLTNAGDRAIDGVALGDRVAWGSAERFAPGSDGRGASRGPFVGAVGRATSYATTTTDGEIEATRDGAFTTTTLRKPAPLAGGESVQSARVFAVGERADVASLVAELTRAAGGALGTLEIALVDGAGRAVPAPEGAKVILSRPAAGRDAGGAGGEAVMTIRAAHAGPTFGGAVPPGAYVATFASGGGRRAASDAPVPVVVRADASARVTLSVGDPGRLALSCMEPRGEMRILALAPCRVTLEGLGGTPSPELAPSFGRLPRSEMASADGKVDIAVSPGKYRVTASSGPESATAHVDVEVAAGQKTWAPHEGAVTLAHVVDARGYLAVDPRPLRPVDAREGIAARASEGIEVLVSDAPAELSARVRAARAPVVVVTPAVVAGIDAPFALALASVDRAAPSATAWRTYVKVDDDGPVTGWDAIREDDLARGVRERRDVVLTNGPFLRVVANGAPIGGVARPRAGVVEVRVHVECPPWLVVDRVGVIRASGAVVESKAVALQPTPSGARSADVAFAMRADASDSFVVTAQGPAGQGPMAQGTMAQRMTGAPAPYAVTGAIQIDGNGHGTATATAPPRIDVNDGGAR